MAMAPLNYLINELIEIFHLFRNTLDTQIIILFNICSIESSEAITKISILCYIFHS